MTVSLQLGWERVSTGSAKVMRNLGRVEAAPTGAGAQLPVRGAGCTGAVKGAKFMLRPWGFCAEPTPQPFHTTTEMVLVPCTKPEEMEKVDMVLKLAVGTEARRPLM